MTESDVMAIEEMLSKRFDQLEQRLDRLDHKLEDHVGQIEKKIFQLEGQIKKVEESGQETTMQFERKLKRQSILSRSVNMLLEEQEKTGGVSGRIRRRFIFGAPDLVPVSISDQELQELPPPEIV